MEAHVRVQKAIKAVRPDASVGIVFNVMQFDPYPDWTSFLSSPVTAFLNHMQNGIWQEFFSKGSFKIGFWPISESQTNEEAINSIDQVGVNQYSHVNIRIVSAFTSITHFDFTKAQVYQKDDIRTEMPQALYAEGFQRALKQATILKKPIIVTETGAPDSTDQKDNIREIWIKRFL